MEKGTFSVQNIHCASCINTIDSALEKKEGILKHSISLIDKRATIEWDEHTLTEADIISTISSLGYPTTKENPSDYMKNYDANTARSLSKYKYKIIFLSIFTIPLTYIAMSTMHKYPSNFAFFNLYLLSCIQAMLAIPVMLSCYTIYKNGFLTLWKRNPTMDSLITMGTLTAFFYSMWALTQILQGQYTLYHQLYFESAAVILTLVTLGKYLEEKAKYSASKSLHALAKLRPEVASKVFPDGSIKELPLSEITKGDILSISQGMTIPLDGIITKGEGSVDESMLTGESIAQYKEINQECYAGTIVQEGSFIMLVTKVSSDTYLQKIITMVENAQASKAPIARLADIVSAYFVPVVIVIALLSSFLWYLTTGSTSISVHVLISTLIIACPCAMGLATPISIVVSLGRAAKFGVIIKNAEVLESGAKITTLIIDKTGTLTEGKPSIRSLYPTTKQYTEEQIYTFAKTLSQYSKHPISHAILEKTEDIQYTPLPCDTFTTHPGKGISATVIVTGLVEKTHKLLLGSHRLLEDALLSFENDAIKEICSTIEEQGASPLFLACDGVIIAIFSVKDTIRSEAKDIIARIKRDGIDVIMLTGDKNSTAKDVATTVGINTIYAQCLPEEKESVVRKYKEKGECVMMIGDGINDIAALSSADIGVAMGTGVDVALESSSLVLMDDSLNTLYNFLRLSKATLRNIKENLFWAFIYNIIGIPIAVGILHIFGGPLLSPMIASFAMVMSSLCVLGNALRLRSFKTI
ncbi:MAG: heavy metal translocating P-type ATPase [Desulfovibrionaceae bacterium]